MIRSSSRARTTERGFVLIAALVLAVLYFGLMELLLIESARDLHEAQRFRARIVAAALAENAAELAMQNVVSAIPMRVSEENDLGRMTAEVRIASVVAGKRSFTIFADATTKGIVAQQAWVRVFGEIEGGRIRIFYTHHSQ